MRNQNKTKTDSSKTATFKSKSTSRKIKKKVGHKGDYAVVTKSHPFIKSVKSGSGSTADPYVYTLDLRQDMQANLARDRALLDSVKNSIEDFKNKYLGYRQKIRTAIRERQMLSFDFHLEMGRSKANGKISDISNNTNVKYSISSIHSEKSSNQVILDFNNEFKIELKGASTRPKFVVANIYGAYGMELAIFNNYDVHIIKADNKEIRFKITSNDIDVTYWNLIALHRLDISFVVEW